MRQSVPRGYKKKAAQPVIITTDNKFTPKISERTIRRKQAAKERKLQGAKHASGLDLCGVICLYMFLIISILIGAGGVGVCAYYLNADPATQAWKIVGIVLGVVVVIIGCILILLSIFKQTRNRPWRYKKQEEEGYGDTNDDDQTNIEDLDDNLHQGLEDDGGNLSPFDKKTRETASSPIQDPSFAPSQLKTITSDIIFCPGCNRSHPSSHQCMYATRIANGFAAPFQPSSRPPQQDSIAIQTEDDKKKTNTDRIQLLIVHQNIPLQWKLKLMLVPIQDQT